MGRHQHGFIYERNSTMTTEEKPTAEAQIGIDSGQLLVDGHESTLSGSMDDMLAEALQRIRLVAGIQRKDILASIQQPSGHQLLLIHPDGNVEEQPAETADDSPASPSPTEHDASANQTTAKTPGIAQHARHSFLSNHQAEEPAKQGWRGTLTRMGLRMAPSTQERAERTDVFRVSQHWPGPRTIVIANGKGGAGKTPTVALLSAVFARYGGGPVLAWDANQTRGTLGWRTEQGPHDKTSLDLLPQVTRLLGTSSQSADLDHYVHHQTDDRYDVLRSQPLALASDQRIGPKDIDGIWQVAAKYYRLVFVDTGNDESDLAWQRVIDHADQLVVATTTRDDHAEAGALLLEALRNRDQHSATLADGAVAIINQADPRAAAEEISRIHDGFADLTRAAVTIPWDSAMVDGWLKWGTLHAATQRAWLTAGSAVAEGL
jgi:MinD-like ATPase involved in chromosome partitioning or flagellar assembly